MNLSRYFLPKDRTVKILLTTIMWTRNNMILYHTTWCHREAMHWCSDNYHLPNYLSETFYSTISVNNMAGTYICHLILVNMQLFRKNAKLYKYKLYFSEVYNIILVYLRASLFSMYLKIKQNRLKTWLHTKCKH